MADFISGVFGRITRRATIATIQPVVTTTTTTQIQAQVQTAEIVKDEAHPVKSEPIDGGKTPAEGAQGSSQSSTPMKEHLIAKVTDGSTSPKRSRRATCVPNPGTPKSRRRAITQTPVCQEGITSLSTLLNDEITVRGSVWLLRMKAGRDQPGPRQGPLSYRHFLEKEVPADITEQIKKDLSRTYPQYEVFQNKDVQIKMYNILKSVAAYRPTLGYLQGMGYIAALLITMMPEEDAFWFMVCMIENFGMEDYWGGSLPGLPKSFFILEKLLESSLPKLSQHLRDMDIQTSAYATPWLITMFLCNHSMPFAMRLWDIILFEGFDYVYNVSLALFTLHETEILKMSFDQVLLFLQFSMKQIGNEPDVEEILRICGKMKQSVQTKVQNFTKLYDLKTEGKRTL